MCLCGFINFYIVSKIFAKNIIKCQFLKINLVNLAQKLCAFVVKKMHRKVAKVAKNKASAFSASLR